MLQENDAQVLKQIAMAIGGMMAFTIFLILLTSVVI